MTHAYDEPDVLRIFTLSQLHYRFRVIRSRLLLDECTLNIGFGQWHMANEPRTEMLAILEH